MIPNGWTAGDLARMTANMLLGEDNYEIQQHKLSDGTTVDAAVGWVQWDTLPPRIMDKMKRCLAENVPAPDRMEARLVFAASQIQMSRLDAEEAVRLTLATLIERQLADVQVIREMEGSVELWHGDEVRVRLTFQGRKA